MRQALTRRPAWVLPLLLACGGDGEGTADPSAGTFDELFERVSTVVLAEPDPPMGAIGDLGRRGEGYLVLDPLTHRVLAFDGSGVLDASFGRQGEGPGEFLRPASLAVLSDGRVFVTDPGTSRITVLDGALRMDAVLDPPIPIAWGDLFQDGLVVETYLGRSGERMAHLSLDGELRASFHPMDPRFRQNPYWPRMGRHVAAAGSREVLAATTLGYPVVRYGPSGDTIGLLAVPPSGFREIGMAEGDGDLAGLSPDGLERLFESFDIISGLQILQDRYAVVVHGRYVQDSQQFVVAVDDRLDIWDLDTGARIHEDVVLPGGARVLVGGPSLAVLTSTPPGPWRIDEFTLRAPGPGATSGGGGS